MEEMLISVNMDVGPMDFTYQDFAGGPHAGRIESIREVKEGKHTYRFLVTDLEEGSLTKGISAEITLGADFTKRGNLGHLANLLIGAGLPQDRCKGEMKFKLSSLVGKTCYFHAKDKPAGELTEDGRAPLQDRNFCTKEQYEAQKRVALSLKAGNGAKVEKSAAKPAGTTPAGGPREAADQIQSAPAPAAETGLDDLFKNG